MICRDFEESGDDTVYEDSDYDDDNNAWNSGNQYSLHPISVS